MVVGLSRPMFRLSGRQDTERIIKEVKDIADVMYSFSSYPIDLIPHSILIKRFLNKGRVIVVDENSNEVTAATDGIYLIINKNFWDGLTVRDKVFLLAHEASHVILKHIIRKKPNHRLWNIAGDAVINSQLIDVDSLTVNNLTPVTRETIVQLLDKNKELFPPDVLKQIIREVRDPSKYGDEDIYMLLSLIDRKRRIRYGKGLGDVGNYGSPDTLPNDVYPVGELAKRLGRKASKEEIEREVRDIVDAVSRAVGVASKMAGTMGGMSTGINFLLKKSKPSKNWVELLRDLMSGLGMNVVSTWLRPSRRNPNYPGYKMYGVEEVVLLVDVSGSVYDYIPYFVNEAKRLFDELNIYRVRCILWDVDIVAEKVVSSLDELKDLIKKKYTGSGTDIYRAMERACEVGDMSKAVIVISDGVIMGLELVKPYIDEAHAIYGVSIFLSVGVIPNMFKEAGWEYAYIIPVTG